MKLSAILISVAVCTALMVVPTAVRAQEADDQSNQVAADTPAAPEPVGPPPSEEVMRPTQRGFRFTRKMAEGLGGAIVREQMKELSISDEQKEELTKKASERAWELNVQYGRDGSQAAECFYEMLLKQAGPRGDRKSMTPDEARQISGRIGPGTKIIRGFWEGSLEDARGILSDDQFAEYEKKAKEALKLTGKFEEKLDRWSRGEVKENESFLDAVEKIDEEDQASDNKSREYRDAERSVRWRIDSSGPSDLRRFWGRAVSYFKFDEGQKAAGNKILKQYIDQANQIMTKEWRAKAMANRVQEQLQYRCQDQPLEPWVFHLDTEYNKMMKPVQEIGRAFRREVLALATAEQREKLLEDLRKLGNEHGMSPEELAVDIFLPEPGPGPAVGQASPAAEQAAPVAEPAAPAATGEGAAPQGQ